MSAEKLTTRALFATTGLKVARELLLCAAGFGNSVGKTLDELAYAALMMEQHFGRRYEDLTGVNLAGVTDEPDLYRGGREEEIGVADEEDEDG